MYRVKRGVQAHRRHKKILKQANPYIKPANEPRFRVCSNRASRAKNKASIYSRVYCNFVH